jgi:hypothetical protein
MFGLRVVGSSGGDDAGGSAVGARCAGSGSVVVEVRLGTISCAQAGSSPGCPQPLDWSSNSSAADSWRWFMSSALLDGDGFGASAFIRWWR